VATALHFKSETVSTPTSDSATLEERLRRREREIDAIYRITTALHASGQEETPGLGPRRSLPKLDEMERQALLVAIETLDATGGTIYVHKPDRKVLVFKHVVNPDPAIARKLKGMEMPDDQGVAGSVFQAGARRITRDAETDTTHNRKIDEQTKFVTTSMITVPLKSMTGNTLGVMQVLNKRDGLFDEEDWEVLEILSAQAASALETARLYEEAQRASVVNLIGDISHDVKNLLTPVVTGTQTLEMMMDSMFEDVDKVRETFSPEQLAGFAQATDHVRDFYKEAMSMVYDGANDAQERVREIADAIKGIVAEPHFQETDFRERVDAVTKVLRVVAERKDVAIDTMGVGETPPMELDRKGIYNALYNLINNAIPETPEGGKIMVRSRLCDLEGRQGVEIQVEDTGRGMPVHVRERLFTENALSTKPGGTGLGTRIVWNVVQAHHGTIRVDSAEGKGTTFTIWIPLRQPREGEEMAAA
jgi:signal transduction histidine kinase